MKLSSVLRCKSFCTREQAQEYCEREYNSDLATIQTEAHLRRALEIIADGNPKFIGLISDSINRLKSIPHYFAYDNGDLCPDECNGKHSGACLCPDFWIEGEPMQCKVGSECVRLIPNEEKLNNDVVCEDTSTAILCNAIDSHTSANQGELPFPDSIYDIDFEREESENTTGINSNINLDWTFANMIGMVIFICVVFNIVYCFYDTALKSGLNMIHINIKWCLYESVVIAISICY